MLVNTHLLIGSYCYEICNESFGLMLDKKRFLYGCIEPDLHKRKNKIQHTYSISRKRMQKYKTIIENEDINIEKMSFLLGKIAHYIADSFCKYHLEDYYGRDMGKHFIYERELHKRLKDVLRNNDDILQTILDDLDYFPDYLNKLEDNREQYLSLEENYLHDIYFTLKTTCYLLYASQSNFKRYKSIKRIKVRKSLRNTNNIR